jgi:hypothetical protein
MGWIDLAQDRGELSDLVYKANLPSGFTEY